jgi:Protein of unknown function (DUF3828)
VIAQIYKIYRTDVLNPDPGHVYSRRLQALIDADRKNTPEGYVGKIDWDVFIDGQDWKLTELKIVPLSQSDTRGRVRAQFKNFGEPREIVYDLVRERGRWLVDDVLSTRKGARWTMSKILLGAPDAFPDEKK